MTKPQKERTDFFQKLLTDKNSKKEDLLIEKIGYIILNGKNIK